MDARRRTCDCYETGSMEKQQLGCLVVAGWLRLCVCAATSRRDRAWVMRCERASECRLARAACGTKERETRSVTADCGICRRCTSR